MAPQRTKFHRLPSEASGGFALVLAVALTGFLLLLVVSLSSVVRVDTRAAQLTRTTQIARENARLGISVALGQLQRHAGADQRITGTAAILDESPETPDTDDGVNQPHWTGVWDSRSPLLREAGNRSPDRTETIEALEREAAWLVSGFARDDAAPRLRPTTAIEDGTTWVTLVGTDASPARHRVAVPRVPVTNAGGGPGVNGSYAYWVGDEGIKAKFNLADPFHEADPDAPGGRLRLRTPPRFAFEFLPDDRFDRYAEIAPTTLGSITSRSQIPLTPASSNPADTGLGDTFFDTTTDSFAVLADSLRGGLRRNLTAFLAGEDEFLAGEAIEPDGNSAAATWEIARSWYQLASAASGGNPVEPQAGGIPLQRHPLHPLLAHAQIYMHASPYTVPPSPEREKRVRAHLFPAITLWNPYDVSLAPADYVVEMRFKAVLQVTDIYFESTDPATGEVSFDDYRGFPGFTDESPDLNPITPPIRFDLYDHLRGHPLRFLLRDVAFEPGQSLVFSPASWEDLDDNAIRSRDWMELNELASGIAFERFNSFNIDTGETIASNRGLPFSALEVGPSDEVHTKLYHRYSDSTTPDADGFDLPADNLVVTLRLVDGDDAPVLQRVRDLIWVRHFDGGDERFEPVFTPGFVEVSGPQDLLQPAKGHIFFIKPAVLDYNDPLQREAYGERRVFARTTNPRALESRADPDSEDDRNPSWGAIDAPQTETGFEPLNDVLRGRNITFLPALIHPEDAVGNAVDSLGTRLPLFALGDIAETGISSPGSLRHARLSTADSANAYSLGESLPAGTSDLAETGVSERLNDAVWDRFLLVGNRSVQPDGSVIPGNFRLRPDPLGNRDITEIAFDDPHEPARHLLVDGAFNVNSTQVAAWRALLAGYAGIPVSIGSGDGGGAPSPGSAVRETPFLPFLTPGRGPNPGLDARYAESWDGYITLDESDVERLAERIVEEIKWRGPAASLSHFVNRRPQDVAIPAGSWPVQTNHRWREASFGTIEAAIQRLTEERNSINEGFPSDGDGLPLGAGVPGFLQQSTILEALGAVLTARSDTFHIRSYGESVDPVTGAVSGRARAEAVVQRRPLPVTDADGDYEPDDELGRRFEVVSFRWLTAGEL